MICGIVALCKMLEYHIVVDDAQDYRGSVSPRLVVIPKVCCDLHALEIICGDAMVQKGKFFNREE